MSLFSQFRPFFIPNVSCTYLAFITTPVALARPNNCARKIVDLGYIFHPKIGQALQKYFHVRLNFQPGQMRPHVGMNAACESLNCALFSGQQPDR